MSREPDCPACAQPHQPGQECQQEPWAAFRDYLPVYCMPHSKMQSLRPPPETERLALREALIAARDSLVIIQESVAPVSGSNNAYAYNHAGKAIERINVALSRS